MKSSAKTEYHLQFPDEYYIVAVDSSLNRPGFAVLTINSNSIVDVKLYNVQNPKSTTTSHGLKIDNTMKFFQTIIPDVQKNIYFVREHAVPNNFRDSSVLLVVGMLNWFLWTNYKKEWYLIYPSTIKKLITGNGKATKKEVAASLKNYVGQLHYACDDESDAVAVGLSFMLKNGVMPVGRITNASNGVGIQL